MKATLVVAIALLMAASGCTSCPQVVAKTPGRGVKGLVYQPIANAVVSFYNTDAQSKHGPPLYTVQTDAEGRFATTIAPGSYIAVARKRQNGMVGGPLVKGDYKSAEIGPVVVTEAGWISLDLPSHEKVDDTNLSSLESAKSDSAISGVVKDADSNPMPNLRVHVYTHVQMSERPKYVSAPTGPDGTYKIYLPKPGTYYICARDSFGGPPKIGDMYGRYDQGDINPSAVVVEAGKVLEGVNVRVTKVW